MLPVRVVLAVQDSEYVEPLLQYIHGSEYVKKVQVTAFTRVEALLQYRDIPDLIVGEANMLEAWLSEEVLSVPWIVLTEGGEELNLAGEGLTAAKYQPLPKLLDMWISHVGGNRTRKNELHSGSTQIIGLVSVLGGSGRTTAAVNMARQLGVMGLKVFYLNLETVNSSALFSGGNRREGTFSRLLYEIKSSQENGERNELSLTRYVMAHDALKCDVFEPSDHLKELMEMTAEDVKVLIDLIYKSGQYDVIVIDTDNQSRERLNAVMENCHFLLWMLLDDLISMYKNGIWLSHMEKENPDWFGQIMGKSRFIVNRFTGSLGNPLPRKDMRMDGVLPYIPSWKQVQQEDLLLCSPIFQREILKLCSDLLGETGWFGMRSTSGERAYG
ncbi:Cellulose biosynthesis protein BcsQ [Paenibacillus uliginis N3/975]|uniref:Cellulose biosynthesis protein BcsQ n=1 Tax=Paenibacillus uliginis N3/975 TaxID=1313296 RepID=A0A1X7GS58_9BACL|nr:AAA family ATPase [Paenibacillus uliginis]SMF73782.1 Cellulose biosynthesis protein BcsQ [Paenibacillus uliginis N3/975]